MSTAHCRGIALALLLCGSCAILQAAETKCRAPGEAVAEPYLWYPKLDLARIPFHTGAGPWGPRAAIVAPTAPVTTRAVRVTSASQFALEARLNGTQIVVDAAYIGPVTLQSSVTDIDIVVPTGKRVAQLTIGAYSPPSTTRRVRVRGTTPGEHSGGTIGSITFLSASTADVIIDGVDLNGEDGKGGNLLWHFARGVERAAVVNVRGHSVGSASLHSPPSTHVVLAGNRLYTGARTREVNGYPEAWGTRGGEQIVVFDNRLEGTRFHRVRVHPKPGLHQYAWVSNNVFVDPYEGRIFSAFNVGGNAPGDRYAAVWAVCNEVYAHSSCMTPSFDGTVANFAMLTSNAFYGNITETLQRTLQNAHGAGRDYLSGNKFSAWREPPKWDGAGDPRTIPLPVEQPMRHSPGLAFKPCPPPS